MNLLDIQMASKLSREILDPLPTHVIRWHLAHNHIPSWHFGLGYVFTTENFLKFLEERKAGKYTKPGRPRKRKSKAGVTPAPWIDAVIAGQETMQVQLNP